MKNLAKINFFTLSWLACLAVEIQGVERRKSLESDKKSQDQPPSHLTQGTYNRGLCIWGLALEFKSFLYSIKPQLNKRWGVPHPPFARKT